MQQKAENLVENIYNADETGLYFRSLPQHTYSFQNEVTGETNFLRNASLLY